MKLLARDHLLSMAAAPIIWAGHFLACYVSAALACALAWSEVRVLGMAPALAAMLAATVVALALLGASAARNLEKVRHVHGDQLSGFMALSALLLGLVSVVAVVWVAFPATLLPACTA